MTAGDDRERALAERVRRRLVAELEHAYEDAAMQGLCGEGALEYALGRVREMDPALLLRDSDDGGAFADRTGNDPRQGD